MPYGTLGIEEIMNVVLIIGLCVTWIVGLILFGLWGDHKFKMPRKYGPHTEPCDWIRLKEFLTKNFRRKESE